MKRRIIYEIFEILERFCSLIPGTLGKYIRRGLYKIFLKKCDRNFFVGNRVKLQMPANIEVGEKVSTKYVVWIASNYIENGQISIGNIVLISPYSILHSSNHNYKDRNVPLNKQRFTFKRIIIEDDVWIAARCTILSGVTIGKGCIFVAGLVVINGITPLSIVARAPRKVIYERF